MEKAEAAAPRTSFGRWCQNTAIDLQENRELSLELLAINEPAVATLMELEEGRNIASCIRASAKTLDYAINRLKFIALTHRER